MTVQKNPSDSLAAVITGIAKSSGTGVTIDLVLMNNGITTAKTSATKGNTWFSTSKTVTVLDVDIVDNIVVSAKDITENPAGTEVELSTLKELTNLTGEKKYALTAVPYSEETLLANAALKWSSSNTSVAVIKAGTNGNAVLTVKSTGSATITVKADKNGGFTKSFKVVVKDSTPRLKTNTLSLNLYKITPSAQLQIFPSNGYIIQDLSIVNPDNTPSIFDVREDAELSNGYLVTIKAEDLAVAKTGKQKVVLVVNTDDNISHRFPMTFELTKKIPTVAVTQRAINLYEKEGTGRITITSDESIADIIYIPNTTKSAYLKQQTSDPNTGCLYFNAVDITKDNYKKTSAKGTLEVKFEGYKDEAAYKKSITLKTNTKLPSFGVKVDTTTLYPNTTADNTKITFIDKSAGETLRSEEGYEVLLPAKMPAKYTCSPASVLPGYIVTAQSGAKGATFKFNVLNDGWLDGIVGSASMNIKVAKTPTLTLSSASIILNRNYNLNAYDPVAVALSIKGFEGKNISSIRVEGKDKKAQAAYVNEAILFEQNKLNGNLLDIGLANSKYFDKNTTCEYIITALTEDGLLVKGTLKVIVTNATATMTIKTKGSINLLDRENTSVICQPTLKNCSGEVIEVDLYGVNANKFDLNCNNGIYMIRAKSGAILNANKAYTLYAAATLESGACLRSSIKITPTQKNPKVVVTPTKATLFESAAGEAFGTQLTFSTPGNDIVEFDQIELVNGGDTFKYIETGSGQGTLYVAQDASMKVNKNYTLKFTVKFKDAAQNVKPITANMTVTYKK